MTLGGRQIQMGKLFFAHDVAAQSRVLVNADQIVKVTIVKNVNGNEAGSMITLATGDKIQVPVSPEQLLIEIEK